MRRLARSARACKSGRAVLRARHPVAGAEITVKAARCAGVAGAVALRPALTVILSGTIPAPVRRTGTMRAHMTDLSGVGRGPPVFEVPCGPYDLAGKRTAQGKVRGRKVSQPASAGAFRESFRAEGRSAAEPRGLARSCPPADNRRAQGTYHDELRSAEGVSANFESRMTGNGGHLVNCPAEQCRAGRSGPRHRPRGGWPWPRRADHRGKLAADLPVRHADRGNGGGMVLEQYVQPVTSVAVLGGGVGGLSATSRS